MKSNLLYQPVKILRSVGPKRAESFAKAGIHTIRHLLYYFPSRYLDRSTIANAAKIYGYVLNGFEGEVTIIGKVLDKEVLNFNRKEVLKVYMRDKSGFFECVWFQGVKFFRNTFNKDEYYAISAKPSITKFGQLQFVHPDFDRFTEDETRKFHNTGKIIPFYRLTKELRTANLGDMSLRKIISSAVEQYAGELTETIPAELIERHSLPGIKEAVRNVHFPESQELLEKSMTRLKFEELFYIELLVALRKHNIKENIKGCQMSIKTHLVSEFLKSLPFELTPAQISVLREIRHDMQLPKPMNRLLQGEVGSGKTIVALIAMLIAKDNGFQSVLMAPTEILADQHYKNITRLVEKFGLKADLVIGGQKKSQRKKSLENIESGQSDIIIGTHALFEENVEFSSLGLVIIDEQHRFGVIQRSRLITKGTSPDVIVMTATPIPRTLSMTVYGDLDTSVINELPKNRMPIITSLRGESRLPQIFKFITEKSREGYQTFIIYPLVKESDKLELKAAETHYMELQETYLKSLRLGMLHGQMSWQEKEEVMFRFLRKEFDVLIATTVIEVGIDIPDANIILINDAHRFGLSQLHQLRGRVGRGNKQAYCILVTGDEYVERTAGNPDIEFLSPAELEKNKISTRLQAMVKYSSGFDISEVDLKLRGPGDIFGIKQSGFPELKYADIVTDAPLLIDAKSAAFELIEADPGLKLPEHEMIMENLNENYQESISFARIA